MALRPIEMVLKEHRSEWMSLPDVVGCGIGAHRGKPCITLLVAKLTKHLAAKLPQEVEGYAVLVTETGEIRALDPN